MPHNTSFANELEINAECQDAVKYLDNILHNFIAAGQCARRHVVEIDKKEVPSYTYFHIMPDRLGYGTAIVADVKMPDCNVDGCNIGSKLLSPVKIVKRPRAIKIDIAKADYPWDKEVILVISARMKKIFELEGVTGLVYEPAQLIAAAHGKKIAHIDGINKLLHKEIPVDSPMSLKPPFIARIPHAVYREADWFSAKVSCQTHLSVSHVGLDSTTGMGFSPINPRIKRKDIEGMDVFQVQGVKVYGQTYNYIDNQFYISRKVLEILLNHKAMGLCRVDIIIKSKFSPLIEISD